jgi:transcriptional regulator with XRE-family HTH domain
MKNKLLVEPFEWINEGNLNFELDDILYNISMKIFHTRISREMNQKEFAELLGVSQSMVSKLESGEYNPTVEQLHKIATKLDLKLRIDLDEKDFKTGKEEELSLQK